MTVKQLNRLVCKYTGANKTDDDFREMIEIFFQYHLALLDGDIEYSPDMTSKRYSYRIAEEVYNEEFDQVDEGKTVGYLTAVKCWRAGDLEQPYEILAYVS